MSSQPPEQRIAQLDLMAQPLALADLLRVLLDLARQAQAAPSEAEFLCGAATVLLRLFQTGRVEIRLVGDAPGVLATLAPDGSIALLSLPPEAEDVPARLLKAPEAVGQAPAEQEAAPPTLSAPLQDAGDILGSSRLIAPYTGQFSDEQAALLPPITEYLALLLGDRRRHEQIGDLAVADERSRLARELHDTVAQSLVALVLRLERSEEPRGDLLEARALARQALEDARRAIWGLRPALLEMLPFDEALAREVERVADEGSLSSRVTVVGQSRPLAPQQEMALFRIAQEALSNTARHAVARRVRISLAYQDDGVRLIVEDDGRGFDPATPEASEAPTAPGIPHWPPYFDASAAPPGAGGANHFGLHTMRERARLVGGWLDLESAPGQGTRVIVHLPYVPLADLMFSAAEPRAVGEALTGRAALLEDETGGHEKSLPPAHATSATLPARSAASRPPAISAGRIRILVVDDHAVTRAGLRRLLEGYADFEVVGEAGDGLEALAEAQDLGPHVVLMDMRMPGMNGLEALRQLRASNPDLRVLMLSAYEQDEDVLESLKAGASGYVLKDIAPDELAQAIRAVSQGETLLAPGLTGKLVDRFGRQTHEDASRMLTAREYEVLRALASGLRNKEIARQLQVSERTITFHLANIYQKLGVTSRTEALRRGLELGLLKS